MNSGTSVDIDSTAMTNRIEHREDTDAMLTVVVTKAPESHGAKDNKKRNGYHNGLVHDPIICRSILTM